MGHLQRGGSPTAFDRILATELGTRAVGLAAQGVRGAMVAVRGGAAKAVPLEVVARGPRLVPRNHRLIAAALGTGVHFG
jgi:6-phosphofructokinase 1